MNLKNERELENTRRKLRDLEGMRDSLVAKPAEDEAVRELTLLSIGRLIKHLKEEIARYECRQPLHR